MGDHADDLINAALDEMFFQDDDLWENIENQQWMDQFGDIIPISAMTTGHIFNVISLIKNNRHPRIKEELARAYVEVFDEELMRRAAL